MNDPMKITLLVTALFLTACQAIPDAEPPVGYNAVYTARGNEPGWILKMDGATLVYEGDYGETKITVPAPVARASFNGMRHVTDRLTVDVTYSNCTDDMSGKRFADTVTVQAEGKTVKGCGGRALPPESLDDTTWTIVMIDQMPVTDGSKTEVRFEGGKVSGSAGCNRFNGTYSASGTSLTFGPLTSTRMMCAEPQMTQENKFLALLAGKLTTRYTIDGNLIIADDKGRRATLKQLL